MIDLDELERLAKAAGGQQWEEDGYIIFRDDPVGSEVMGRVSVGSALSGEIADFIAAANPATILALTAELRTLRAQRHELAGVVADVEVGRGFDDICLKTIKRVIGVLGGAAHPKEGV